MDDPFASLDHFLRTDPRDAGCTNAFDMLDLYVERQLADADAERCYPRLAAHLVSCEACRVDFEGLLQAVGKSPRRNGSTSVPPCRDGNGPLFATPPPQTVTDGFRR